MQLLVQAKYIPDGATVYKKTGDTAFVIRDKLNIYSYGTAKEEGGKGEVKVEPTCKFMVDRRGNVNIVGGETILRIDLEQLDAEYDGYEINMSLLESILEKRLNMSISLDAYIPQ